MVKYIETNILHIMRGYYITGTVMYTIIKLALNIKINIDSLPFLYIC